MLQLISIKLLYEMPIYFYLLTSFLRNLRIVLFFLLSIFFLTMIKLS